MPSQHRYSPHCRILPPLQSLQHVRCQGRVCTMAVKLQTCTKVDFRSLLEYSYTISNQQKATTFHDICLNRPYHSIRTNMRENAVAVENRFRRFRMPCPCDN